MLVDQRTWLHGGCCCSSGCHTQIHTHTLTWRRDRKHPVRPDFPASFSASSFWLPHGTDLSLHTHIHSHTHTYLVPTYHTPHPRFNTKSGPSRTRIKPLQLNQILIAHPSSFFKSDSLMATGRALAQGTARPRHIAPRLSANHEEGASHKRKCATFSFS